MKELLKEIKNVEQEITNAEEAFSKECVDVYKSEGYDDSLKKWQKKIDNIASKYAKIIAPLKDKHDELREKYNTLEEENRKKKYKDVF